MRTLDQCWQQFTDNTLASIKVTTAVGNFTDARKILAGQLGLCEAVVAHVTHLFQLPQAYTQLLDLVRAAIQVDDWQNMREIVDATDCLYSMLIARQERNTLTTIQFDALSSLGWLARAVLFLAAGMLDKANEASNNTLDCIARVVIVTGHMRSDLFALMRSIGVMARVAV